MSNDEVLQKIETRRKLILNIRERQLKFLGLREVLNLLLTEKTDGNRYIAKQRITYLWGLRKGMAEQGLETKENDKIYLEMQDPGNRGEP